MYRQTHRQADKRIKRKKEREEGCGVSLLTITTRCYFGFYCIFFVGGRGGGEKKVVGLRNFTNSCYFQLYFKFLVSSVTEVMAGLALG